jgi:IS1 family transposase
MNRLDSKTRAGIVASLVEGNSMRATCRMTGAAKNTVAKLLVDLGTVCSIHMDRSMQNLTCERLQVDEIWSFVYAKQKNVPADKRGQAGDVWTWVALDADTKLVPSYRIGPRDYSTAVAFMNDLQGRLANRVQLTTDGFHSYLRAVTDSFGPEAVDYAQLIKVYGRDGNDQKPNRRYSPAVCLEADRTACTATPTRPTSARATSSG